MNEPMEATKSREVKPWARLVVEAAGVYMPAHAEGEKLLGWWGVEMAHVLRHSFATHLRGVELMTGAPPAPVTLRAA